MKTEYIINKNRQGEGINIEFKESKTYNLCKWKRVPSRIKKLSTSSKKAINLSGL